MFPLPEYPAVLDLFSQEAKEIVRTSPPLGSLPQEVSERAVKRVMWKTGGEMMVGFKSSEVRMDVLSFYLMCQGVAAVSYPYSREVRLVSEKTAETIRYRMYYLFSHGYGEQCLGVVRRYFRISRLENRRVAGEEIPKEDLFKLRNACLARAGIQVPSDRIPPQYVPEYTLPWVDLAPLLRQGRIQLTDLYVVRGSVVITPYELWDMFAWMMSMKCEEYIAALYERFTETGPPPEVIGKVGERISSLFPPELEVVERGGRFPRGKLRPEFFPPCVKRALAGVGSGARNYAITVLLTSFLSYARISPSGKAAMRIKDFVDNLSVLQEEVIPLIFEAAERCNPPLFRDQPQERANVYYHLGFGMTTEPRLEDSGRSRWYKTPNCRKIASSAPLLCTPDETCKEVKNPLTYYYKRLARKS